MEIGCLARFFNRYKDEVEFVTKNNFDFMQLWYDNRGLCLHKEDEDFINTIKQYKFPTIIHAVLNINEFEEHIPKLLDILKELEQKEIIIHPICENEELEFILDIAHIDNMNHIRDMVSCKKTKILHIADKHFDVVHEHLPIGHGEIDFGYIFNNILSNYEGKIILEIANDDLDIVNSKRIIEHIINKK